MYFVFRLNCCYFHNMISLSPTRDIPCMCSADPTRTAFPESMVSIATVTVLRLPVIFTQEDRLSCPRSLRPLLYTHCGAGAVASRLRTVQCSTGTLALPVMDARRFRPADTSSEAACRPWAGWGYRGVVGPSGGTRRLVG
jgi:hypothetical protein